MANAAGSTQNLIIGDGTASVHSEILMANFTSGMQLDGRMSAVRRFFCLYVTFDLLFTTLFWILCILVNGQYVLDALTDQILHYTIKSSTFDVVVCAFIRFLFLIVFYAAFHINHWWAVAISTALTSGLTIAKGILYRFPKDSSSYPFEVMFLLTSFCITWSEAWLLDFRVLTQELRAKKLIAAAKNVSERNAEEGEGGRMERIRDYLSHYAESAANFYSPLQSPAESDEEDEYNGQVKTMSPEEREYALCGEQALRQSWETLNSSGWTLEKTVSHNDIIFSKKCPRGYKIYKLMAQVEACPESLFKECLENFENMPKWNNSLTYCKIIQGINSNTDVTYQVAAEGPGGMVSPRDFVSVRSWAKISNAWITAGISVIHPNMPIQKNCVRAVNGPTCLVFGPISGSPNRCAFQWLLDVDLKGWIPKYVIEQALTHAVIDFLTCIKTFAPSLEVQPRAVLPQYHPNPRHLQGGGSTS